jgi:hypothetical protein
MLQRLIDLLARLLRLPRRGPAADADERDENTYPMW